MSSYFILFTFIVICCKGYNNGIGKTPIMGWSPWYGYESNITEDIMKENALAIISRGLASVGYTMMVLSEGWLLNRSSNGTLIYDPIRFPNGVYNLGEFMHSNNLLYGLYSSRGKVQCGTSSYSAPGSYGYYQQDAEYMANNGADYFKFDSCGAVGTMQDAFNQYNEFGNYLNQTGRPIYYDLCGWYWYYAINGSKYSNSWRISQDDASWAGTLYNMFIGYSGMWKYGNQYGWNNWDMIYSQNINSSVNIGHHTELQARAQMSVYSVGSTNLILGNIVNTLTDYDIQTYTNIDVININQDEGPINMGIPIQSGFKIAGITPTYNISIFGKMLSDGSFAAVFLNTIPNANSSMNITCDEGCFLKMGFNESVKTLSIKDLWSNTSLGTINRINNYKSNNMNGVLEMAMCSGDKYQQFEYDNNTKYIKSKLNNGYIQTYNCNNTQEYTTIISTINIDINNKCNGNNGKWNIIEINNSSQNKYCNNPQRKCVSICNQNYESNKENNNNCLYVDTIDGDIGYYPLAFFEDGSIREMNGSHTHPHTECISNTTEPQAWCRCLQIRPYIGTSSFEYTVNNVSSNGGVVMLQFSPV